MLQRQASISSMFPQEKHAMEVEVGSAAAASVLERPGSRFDERGPSI